VPVDTLHALDDDVEATVEQVDLNLDYAHLPATEDVFLQGLDYVHATSGSVPQDFPMDFGLAFSSDPSAEIDPGIGAMIGLGGLSEALPPLEVMEELQVLSGSREPKRPTDCATVTAYSLHGNNTSSPSYTPRDTCEWRQERHPQMTA